jgi:hypothetical protein
MNTKAKDSTAKDSASRRGGSSDPPNFLSELGRHQLALAVEGTTALCRGSEALRKIQQDAAHDASVFHEETAQRLFASCQPAELMAIQSELMRFTLQSAGSYWQKIAARMMQTQVEMIKSVTHVLEREKDTGTKSPMEVLQSAMPPLASSFFPMTAHVPEGQPLHS